MKRTHPSRTIATTVLVLGLVSVLAACGPTTGSPNGSAGPASPVATASPSASPDASGSAGTTGGGAIGGTSPAPSADVPALFLKALRDPFRANASVEGEMTVGTATYAFTGTSQIDGQDNHQTITVATPGATERTETLTLDGVKYENRDGLWFEKSDAKEASGSGPGSDFTSVLKSLLDVTDVGVVSKGGLSLHHLKPKSDKPLPISAIGMADPGGDGTVTFDFYARNDGTPVVMVMNATWTAVNGSVRTPVRMTLDYSFSDVGGPVVIERPDQVWTSFTSKRFKYTIAHPSDWEAEQGTGRKKPDVLLSADLASMYVYRYPTGGLSLNNATSTFIDGLKKSKTKAKVTSNTATTVDGTRARRLELTNVYRGTRGWFIDLVVVRGKYIYFFEYTTLEKTTKADRNLFDDFQKSVKLPAKGAAATGSTQST